MNLDNHPNNAAPRPASRRNSTRRQKKSNQSLPFLGNSCPELGVSLCDIDLVYDACTSVSHNPIPKLKASKVDVPPKYNPESRPKKPEQKKPRKPITTGIRRRQSIRRLKAHEATICEGAPLETTWSRSLPKARRGESTRHLHEEPEPRDAPPRVVKRRISSTTGKRTASSSRPRDERAPRNRRTRTSSEDSSVVIWERRQDDRAPRARRTRTCSEDSSVVTWERQQSDIRLVKPSTRSRSRDRPQRTRSSLVKTKSGESRTSARSGRSEIGEGRGRRSSTTRARSSRRPSLRNRSNSRGSPIAPPKQTSAEDDASIVSWQRHQASSRINSRGSPIARPKHIPAEDDAYIVSWQRHQASTGKPRPRRRPSGIRQHKR